MYDSDVVGQTNKQAVGFLRLRKQWASRGIQKTAICDRWASLAATSSGRNQRAVLPRAQVGALHAVRGVVLHGPMTSCSTDGMVCACRCDWSGSSGVLPIRTTLTGIPGSCFARRNAMHVALQWICADPSSWIRHRRGPLIWALVRPQFHADDACAMRNASQEKEKPPVLRTVFLITHAIKTLGKQSCINCN